MKKILVSLFIILMVFSLAGYSEADGRTRTYNLYLSSTVSGSTTAASGTSIMILEGSGINRSEQVTTIKPYPNEKIDTIVFQLNGITMRDYEPPISLTNYSGTTITIGYTESLIDDDDHWNKAGASNFLSGVLFSGNSKVIVPWSPTGLGNIRFHFISGVTPISAVTATVILHSEK